MIRIERKIEQGTLRLKGLEHPRGRQSLIFGRSAVLGLATGDRCQQLLPEVSLRRPCAGDPLRCRSGVWGRDPLVRSGLPEGVDQSIRLRAGSRSAHGVPHGRRGAGPRRMECPAAARAQPHRLLRTHLSHWPAAASRDLRAFGLLYLEPAEGLQLGSSRARPQPRMTRLLIILSLIAASLLPIGCGEPAAPKAKVVPSPPAAAPSKSIVAKPVPPDARRGLSRTARGFRAEESRGNHASAS